MKLWEAFLSELEKELGKEATSRWLNPLKVVDYDAANLYLKAEDAFQVLFFEKEIRKIALERFVGENGRKIKIHLSASDLPHSEKKRIELPPSSPYSSTPLDPSHTFATFIPGEKNGLLMQFLEAKTTENPLFLFGGPGVGKTHLLMAIGAKLQLEGKRVFFTHAETFTEHVVKAIRSGDLVPLRQTYRHVDVLLVDDIHALAGRRATQEEFFHTFNSLHSRGCKIVLSSTLSPCRLSEIEPRLISRFEWGILFEVYPVAQDLLLEVLKKRAEQLQLVLSDEVTSELSRLFISSPKALLRAFHALALRAKGRVTKEALPLLLSDLLAEEKKEKLSAEKILKVVADYFHVQVEDLLGRSQAQEVTLPRHIAIFLCRQELHLSFPSIGKLFSRDHSTILASNKAIGKKREKEPEIARALFDLKTELASYSYPRKEDRKMSWVKN